MIEEFRQDGWTFTHFPTNLSIEDYEKTKDIISNGVLTESDCSVFMSYNGKSVIPGISDIDYVTVTDNISDNLKNLFSINAHSGSTKEVLFHDHLFIPYSLSLESSSVLGNIILNAELVYGKKIPFNKSSFDSNFFRVMDDVVVHTARAIYRPLFTRQVNVRSLLHKLRSLEHHNFTFLDMDGSFKAKLNLYFAEIIDLRKGWFYNTKESNCAELIRLLKKYVYFQNKLFILLDEFIKVNYLSTNTINPNYLISDSYPLIFKDSDNFDNESLNIFKDSGVLIPVFPSSFAFILVEYSKYSGTVSNFIKKNLNNKTSLLSPKFYDLAQLRISFFNEHLTYCKQNKLAYGPMVSFNLHDIPSSLKSKLSTPIKSCFKRRKVKKAINTYFKN